MTLWMTTFLWITFYGLYLLTAFLIIILVVIFLYLSILERKALRHAVKYRSESTHTVPKLDSAALIRGRIRSSEEPLRTPFTATLCYFYEILVIRSYRRSYTTELEEIKMQPLFIESHGVNYALPASHEKITLVLPQFRYTSNPFKSRHPENEERIRRLSEYGIDFQHNFHSQLQVTERILPATCEVWAWGKVCVDKEGQWRIEPTTFGPLLLSTGSKYLLYHARAMIAVSLAGLLAALISPIAISYILFL